MPSSYTAQCATTTSIGPWPALRKISRAIIARQPARDVLALIVQEALTITGAANVAIGLRSDTAELLSFLAVAGENASEVMGLQIRIDDSLAESTLRTGQPALFRDGVQLPVQPENWKHYIGFDLAHLDRDLDRILSDPAVLDRVAVAGRTWTLEHYSPVAMARNFLRQLDPPAMKSPVTPEPPR